MNINRDALYKCVEREIKNQKPAEIMGYEMMTNYQVLLKKTTILHTIFLQIPQQGQANPLQFQVPADAQKELQMLRTGKTK